ncbi:hypothetical protein ACSFA3_17270 [Variovorax sp. RHLX14]|uniref:hypothetical protein n=1 Tax=Variovorax sp. RHLX14 TaxID=1259731 RepID=UPI003F467199
MTPLRRKLTFAATSLVVLFGTCAAFVAWKLPSDDQLAARLAQEFRERTGVELKIGRLHWTPFPSPRIVIEEVATVQDAPIRAHRLAAAMPWRAVFAREVRIDSLEADGLAVPRESTIAFRGKGGKGDTGISGSIGSWKLADTPLAHLRVTDATWVDRRGIALSYDGSIDFDPNWRPRTAELSRRDASPPARLRVERESTASAEDRWRVLIDVAAGTVNGTATFKVADGGQLSFNAQLAPRNLDVELLVKSFGRSAPVSGKVNGETEVDTRGEGMSELTRNLHTRTRFAVSPAALTKFDLAAAVKTAGISRGGRTPLDQLSGTLDTQATSDGTQMTYRDLKARSGLLTATGSARILNRKLDGEAAVDIVDGVVGVPLKLGGTLDAPELSLTGGALAGAAVGSAVLPGVGTAIGARIGQQLERIFGSEGKKKQPHKGPRAQ